MRRKVYFGIGAVIAALLLFGLSTMNARTPSVASLRGTCIWQEVKLPTTSGNQQSVGPATILAAMHFDGSGNMSMDYDVNLDGTYSSTDAVPGSYSVDSTGHGSFSFTSPASGYLRTYDFRMSPSNRTLYSIAQSDGVGTVAERVSTGTCVFEDQDGDDNRFGRHDSGFFWSH